MASVQSSPQVVLVVHYLLFYEVVDDYVARRAEFREEHLRLAWAAHSRGELLLGGALAAPPDGAVLLFQGDSPTVAEAFAQADPYVKNGLITRWYVRAWTTVAGEWAQTPVVPAGTVQAVSAHPTHSFSKQNQSEIRLIEGQGVEGDAHCGVTVKHRSRVAQNPDQPNLRQVHLIHTELFAELADKGFTVQPGDMGENIATQGIDLLSLPVGTKLSIGSEAVVTLTGLRNPCGQIDNFQKGLLAAVLDRDAEGNLVRKSGVMGVVTAGGTVTPGDAITVELPPPPHKPMERV